MVKFTFASIFLTLASVFALVSAVPVASSYGISSVQTGGVIFSDGKENEGDTVIAIPASEVNPGDTVGGPITLIL